MIPAATPLRVIRMTCTNNPTVTNYRGHIGAKRKLSTRSTQMTITWAVFFTILLLITVAVLGHSVWHTEVLAIMNLLTELFTGGHAVG
jgi:hypothetical protein